MLKDGHRLLDAMPRSTRQAWTVQPRKTTASWPTRRYMQILDGDCLLECVHSPHVDILLPCCGRGVSGEEARGLRVYIQLIPVTLVQWVIH